MGCSVSSNLGPDKIATTQVVKLNTLETPSTNRTSRSSRPRGMSFSGPEIMKKGSSSSYKEYNFMSPAIRSDSQSELRHVIYRPTGSKKTAKIVFKKRVSKELAQQIYDEFACLEMLDHPNIPKVFEFFEYGSNIILILDYVYGHDLVEYIVKTQAFSEKDAANLMEQLLSALNYCHNHEVLHRNLRLESLVVDANSSKPSLKIIEFGVASFGEKKETKLTHIAVH
jgi:calcium-dependent protein kinase